MCLITVELLIISYEQNSEHDAQWAYLKSRSWKVSRLNTTFPKKCIDVQGFFYEFFLFFNPDLI